MDASKNAAPLRLDMWGVNWFTGGHWDHYIAEFYDFEADPQFADDTFAIPHLCENAPVACGPSPCCALKLRIVFRILKLRISNFHFPLPDWQSH